MDAISVTAARAKLYNLINDVNLSHRPVHIHNKNGPSAVLLSAEDWSAIEETMYLNSIPNLASQIISAANAPLSDFIDEEDVDI